MTKTIDHKQVMEILKLAQDCDNAINALAQSHVIKGHCRQAAVSGLMQRRQNLLNQIDGNVIEVTV